MIKGNGATLDLELRTRFSEHFKVDLVKLNIGG